MAARAIRRGGPVACGGLSSGRTLDGGLPERTVAALVSGIGVPVCAARGRWVEGSHGKTAPKATGCFWTGSNACIGKTAWRPIHDRNPWLVGQCRIALPAKCQGWGEFALPPFHPACGSVARRLPPVRTPLGAGWRSSRRQRPLATFRRPLAISFRRLTNRLGKVKNGRSRSSRWRFEL